MRIPMIAHCPELIKASADVRQMVANIDIAPTMLDLAGMAVPKDVHGKSLLPLFRGDAIRWRTATLSEYFKEQQYPHVPTWRAVR